MCADRQSASSGNYLGVVFDPPNGSFEKVSTGKYKSVNRTKDHQTYSISDAIMKLYLTPVLLWSYSSWIVLQNPCTSLVFPNHLKMILILRNKHKQTCACLMLPQVIFMFHVRFSLDEGHCPWMDKKHIPSAQLCRLTHQLSVGSQMFLQWSTLKNYIKNLIIQKQNIGVSKNRGKTPKMDSL